MKLISPKLAASVCLLAILAAPLTGFANPRGWDKEKDKDKKYSVAEPGTLAMTVAGLGLGMGLVLFGLRRNRKNVTT
jgi:hypothetical protein